MQKCEKKLINVEPRAVKYLVKCSCESRHLEFRRVEVYLQAAASCASLRRRLQRAEEEHGDTGSTFPMAFPAGGINSIRFSQRAGADKLQPMVERGGSRLDPVAVTKGSNVRHICPP